MAPPAPEVVVVLVRPEVVAVQAQLVDRARLRPQVQLAVLLQLQRLALLEVEAERAVEAVSVEALHHRRSFSVVMAGKLPSTGTPRYSPVPRSGRIAKRRP